MRPSTRALATAALVAIAAMGTAGCDLFGNGDSSAGPTGPTSPGASAFIGRWQSSSSGPISPSACSNIDWQITGVSGSTVSGAFTATCAGGFQVVGTGTGTPSATGLDWTAVGTATQGSVSCPFSLAGTATPQGGAAIDVTYTGSVCGIGVTGTETLTKT